MSNIPQNRFLNSDNNSTFSNDGSLNLYINNLKIAGLSPSMPMATDAQNNVVSTNIISVPSGELAITSPDRIYIHGANGYGSLDMDPVDQSTTLDSSGQINILDIILLFLQLKI